MDLGQTAPNPVLTTMRHFRQEFEDHIVSAPLPGRRVQELALSPCENSCPLHMNIPRFLQLYKEGPLEDAFESIIMDNPLPARPAASASIPATSAAAAQAVDEPVNMREVHRFIADYILLSDRFETQWSGSLRASLSHRPQDCHSRRRPGGLTAAFYLALLGTT